MRPWGGGGKTDGLYGVFANHNSLKHGDIIYAKEFEWRYNSPTDYKIINRDTGRTIDYITATKLRSRFVKIN